jgi:hypothetical protein
MQMKSSILRIACCLFSGLLAGSAEVITYPAPTEEVLSPDYEVWADGKKVDVYQARTLDAPFAGKQWNFGGAYSFANFDMAGKVTVRIVAKRSLAKTVILPASTGLQPKIIKDQEISLTLDRPHKISIEPDGKNGPLLLFANPLETDVPTQGTPGVIYFGPGLHKPGKIEVRSNQILYLAGGAVVKGGISAQGENIQIRGKGILDGSDWEWRKGPTPNVVAIRGTNVTVRDITIRGASHWTVVPRGSRNVTIRNIKLCNSRVQNDDGINPCNSQDVLITDCFLRTDDDCVAMKGLELDLPNNNVERVTVENCVLWCDRARIFLLGHESRAAYMRNIVLRNLDIIHFTMTPFLFEPGEDMRLENLVAEDIRINGEGQKSLIRLAPVINQYMKKQVPGVINNITFKNISLTGKPGEYKVQIYGADAAHDVKNVQMENVRIQEKLLQANSPEVSVGKHTEGILFR